MVRDKGMHKGLSQKIGFFWAGWVFLCKSWCGWNGEPCRRPGEKLGNTEQGVGILPWVWGFFHGVFFSGVGTGRVPHYSVNNTDNTEQGVGVWILSWWFSLWKRKLSKYSTILWTFEMHLSWLQSMCIFTWGYNKLNWPRSLDWLTDTFF